MEPEPYSALMGPLSTSTRSISLGLIVPNWALIWVAVLTRAPSILKTREPRPRPRMLTSDPQAESEVMFTPGMRASSSEMLMG